MNMAGLSRRLHRWASIAVAVQLGIIIATGILLLLKKEIGWIQPPTQRGSSGELTVSFNRILEVARTIPQAGVKSWDDIDRLDVRPGEGMVKVRCKNRCEVQIDTKIGDVLQVAVRRSDVVEDIHTGAFFHKRVKLWIFLPSGVILFLVWASGILLFLAPYLRGSKKKPKAESI